MMLIETIYFGSQELLVIAKFIESLYKIGIRLELTNNVQTCSLSKNLYFDTSISCFLNGFSTTMLIPFFHCLTSLCCLGSDLGSSYSLTGLSNPSKTGFLTVI